MTVFVIVLIAICAKLWGDVSELKRRVGRLEGASYVPVAGPVEPERARVRAAPLPADTRRSGYVSPWAVGTEAAAASAEPPPAPVGPARPVRVEHAPDAWYPPIEEAQAREFSLEGLFGRTLPIWAGGITLAVAGILVVKWSIDMGLVSPAVRVFMGFLFGLGLVAGAEIAIRRRVADERIPQALAGAGVASFYGALLAASLMYGILPDAAALVGMVVVTIGAGALSMRFGAPAAVLGLAGGLAAPALVGGETPSVPLLSLYVAMVSGGMACLARVQGRTWLGGLSMAGAALWALVLLAAVGSTVSVLALGLLMLFTGLAIPEILPADRNGVAARTAGGLLVLVQTATLVAMGGFGVLQWSMLAIASAAALLTSERDGGFRDAPAVALATFAALVMAWPDPGTASLCLVLVVFGVMHALHAVRHLAFAELPRMADGIRLVALPVVVCAALQVHLLPDGAAAAALWALGAAATACAIVIVGRSGLERLSSLAQPVAVGMGALAAGFALPYQAIPLALLVAAAGLSLARGWRIGAAVSAASAAVWAVPQFLIWFVASLSAAFSGPLLVTSLPSAYTIVWAVLPAVAAGLLLAWRDDALRIPAAAVSALLGTVAVHVLWRNVLAISDAESFASLGLLDRTLWEALLAGAAAALWRTDRRISAALALASLGHFAWFTLLRHDPLWSAQAVGPVPFLNLATLCNAVPLALLWVAGRAGLHENWERVRKVGQMAIVFSMGMMVLRQLFAGSVMYGVTVSEGEDIMRSVLAIAMALGFLLYGIWSTSIEWRAGSLVLMLGAVTKVFLFDAAGLDGLARVASFAALGFSLIGVGWLYSRLLPEGGRA
jgi:uncharacterized membrane protein